MVALITSVLCSSTAFAMVTTVLGKQVFDLTGRELDLGLLGLAEFAPAALLVFVTGPLADRVDRRRLASIALVLEALVFLGLAAYAGTAPTSVLPIFLLVIAFGTARAFATPATRALPADLVPAAKLPRLVARQAASWQSAAVVGPVLGGFLYVADVRLPFVAGAALMLLSSIAMSRVRGQRRPARARTPGGLREAMEGLRFVRGDPILLGAISLDLFAVLFGGAVALLPAIAEDRLGVGAVGLGWLRAAVGIGAGAVTLVLVLRPVTRRIGNVLLVTVALFGAGTIVLGVTTSFVVAFLALAALSGADSVSVFIRSTLVPLVTPDDKRGRVLAVEAVFIGASNELGAFESGVVGQLLGGRPSCSWCTSAVAATSGGVLPALRGRRFPAVDHTCRRLGPLSRSGGEALDRSA